MTISSEERQRRRGSLGSSDIPAIFGFHYPYRTGADVQAEKLYELEEIENAGNVRLGNLFERTLCEIALRESKVVDESGLGPDGFVRYSPPAIVHPTLPLHANLDCLVPGLCVVEAKLTGKGDEWGEPGTDEVPDSVVVQVQEQMMLAEVEFALVGVLIVGFRPDARVYRVERSGEIIEEIARRSESWWLDHIIERKPVPPEPPTFDTLKRIVRTPQKTAVIDPGLVQMRRMTALAAKTAKGEDKAAKRALLAAMADAEAATDVDGNVLATYFMGKPQHCAACGHETKKAFRTLRLKGEE